MLYRNITGIEDSKASVGIFGFVMFVCKSYYFECLIKELGINSNTSSNTTYKPTSFDKDEILANHRSFMTSLINIPSGKESRIYPIYIGYLNSIRHHTKKGT